MKREMTGWRHVPAVAMALTLWCGDPQSAAGQTCVGDANGNGAVTIDELVTAVNNSLNGCEGSGTGAEQVIESYARLLFANYTDTEVAALRLQETIDELVANPAQVTLDAARAAWLAARPTYQQSEIGRFYEGPIDNEENGPEGRVNGWPLDENFIDYTSSNPDAGIINAVADYPVLSKELIAGQNEQGGEANISSGWHGIEFLLWGQDLRADGPGARRYTDYVVGPGGTAANQARRGQYLRLIAELMLDDLRAVKTQWAPGRGDNYRAAFVALDTEIALARILTGIGTLSGFELSNERMAVALETQDQEDEHSCFSDNTHVDHRFDQLGIDNVYFGRYGTLDGAGIDDLVRAVNPTLDQQMQSALQASRSAIFAIPIPFDRSILGADTQPARQAIIAAVDALRQQTSLIEDVAAALGVDITTTQ